MSMENHPLEPVQGRTNGQTRPDQSYRRKQVLSALIYWQVLSAFLRGRWFLKFEVRTWQTIVPEYHLYLRRYLFYLVIMMRLHSKSHKISTIYLVSFSPASCGQWKLEDTWACRFNGTHLWKGPSLLTLSYLRRWILFGNLSTCQRHQLYSTRPSGPKLSFAHAIRTNPI